MPNRNTVLRWVRTDDGRRKQYQHARQAQADWYGDDIKDIAWDTSNDTIIGKDGQPLCNHEWIARSRLKVDTLKFLMAKLHPTQYGEKQQVELPAVQSEVVQIRWMRSAPVYDDDGIINGDDNNKLRARIAQLEERLGIRDGKPRPKLLSFDPGPLPRRLNDEIRTRLAKMILDNVPDADNRSPESVFDEVLSECERAMKAKYGSDVGS